MRPPPRPTLLPYTTLFRSRHDRGCLHHGTSALPRSMPMGRRAGARRKMAPSALPCPGWKTKGRRSEEHTSELQSQFHLVCRLLLEKKKHVTIRVPSLSANV